MPRDAKFQGPGGFDQPSGPFYIYFSPSKFGAAASGKRTPIITEKYQLLFCFLISLARRPYSQ